ncbi:MAG TPA: hypothetical protein VFO79_02365, partial [Xanthomonadales bacterium]|nr:hypothetical protein [Xanthomonadales bacterium]
MGPEPRRRCIARLAFAALLALAASPQLAAYSYRMISDEALLAQSPVVFTARVAEVLKPEPDAAGVVRETRYRLDVLGRHKGALPDEVVLVLPGATSAHRGPRYAGIPRYAVGEILMLFAAQHARGDYRPMQLLLGVFRGMKKDGAELLVRPLDEEGAVDPGFNATYAQARDMRRFVAWVEATARGAVAPADYFAPVPQEAAAKFTQMYLDFGSAGRFPA